MSKANQALSQPVKKLLKGVGVRVMTYEEINSKVNFLNELPNKEITLTDMSLNKAFHNNEASLIGVDDDALLTTEDANELVLHELVHMTKEKLNRIYSNDQDNQTEDCVAQIGMFKLTLVLGLNPAPYADKTLEYIKQFPKVNFRKVEIDSDKAVEYLMKSLDMERVA